VKSAEIHGHFGGRASRASNQREGSSWQSPPKRRASITYRPEKEPKGNNRNKEKSNYCLSELLFDPEDVSNMFFRHVVELIPDYTMSRPRRWYRCENLKSNILSVKSELHTTKESYQNSTVKVIPGS
jgi:hypothetical protein